MFARGELLVLSATDLINFLGCCHATFLARSPRNINGAVALAAPYLAPPPPPQQQRSSSSSASVAPTARAPASPRSAICKKNKNRRRRPTAAPPPRRLERVGLLAAMRAARLAHGKSERERLTGGLVLPQYQWRRCARGPVPRTAAAADLMIDDRCRRTPELQRSPPTRNR